VTCFNIAGCATPFTFRATTEEYKILSKKESLNELLSREETSDILRHKFELVLQARKFALNNGLKPEGSFTEYADIQREVLVWVLSAAPKTSLRPYTWWYPIVGSVPYKGSFDSDLAKKRALELKSEDYDVFLRPSPAFSTLGWFKDPLLSTYIEFDDVDLVTTVFHEIFHNTVWIPGDAFFNESAANVVGYLFSIAFFNEINSPKLAQHAQDALHDELIFADFLEELNQKLEVIYKNDNLADAEKITAREVVFSNAIQDWTTNNKNLKTENYKKVVQNLNNAVIIAFRIYLSKPTLFVKLFDSSKGLEDLIRNFGEIKQSANKSGESPYSILEEMLDERQQ